MRGLTSPNVSHEERDGQKMLETMSSWGLLHFLCDIKCYDMHLFKCDDEKAAILYSVFCNNIAEISYTLAVLIQLVSRPKMKHNKLECMQVYHVYLTNVGALFGHLFIYFTQTIAS